MFALFLKQNVYDSDRVRTGSGRIFPIPGLKSGLFSLSSDWPDPVRL